MPVAQHSAWVQGARATFSGQLDVEEIDNAFAQVPQLGPCSSHTERQDGYHAGICALVNRPLRLPDK